MGGRGGLIFGGLMLFVGILTCDRKFLSTLGGGEETEELQGQ